MKDLIITGYYTDQIIAGGLILSNNKDADIEPIAKKELLKKLAKVAKDKKYNKIIIVGFNLDYLDLDKTLKKLKRQKTEIVWILSAYHNSKTTNFAKYADFYIYKKGELSEICANAVGISKDNPILKRANLLEQNIENKKYEYFDHIKLIGIIQSRVRRLGDIKQFRDLFKFLGLAETNARSEFKKFANIISEYERFGERELKGKSAAIEEIRNRSRLIGKESSCSVLILGETGTGKETVANLIHGFSERKNSPFIAVNCAVLSPKLQHSQLFGHKKGSFTGADESYDGVFKQADGGTIFLDEIAELSPEIQSGLLRVLQEGTFSPLGDMSQEYKVDVRIIAATNENLIEKIKTKEFRADLFYRIASSIIKVPPLRERKEDIKPIIENILYKNKEIRILTPAHYKELENYNWGGNVRELENILNRAKIEYFDYKTNKIKDNAFFELIKEQEELFAISADNDSEKLDCVIRKHISKIYEKYKGKIPQKKIAKDILDISENTLKKYKN